ncbi:hypothetical protein ACWF94_40300, partial [Streptomyces sp. NPDC055078]
MRAGLRGLTVAGRPRGRLRHQSWISSDAGHVLNPLIDSPGLHRGGLRTGYFTDPAPDRPDHPDRPNHPG